MLYRAARAESVKGIDKSKISFGNGAAEAMNKTQKKKKGFFARLFGKD